MTINLSDWAVTDEPLPQRTRGLSDDLRALADMANGERLASTDNVSNTRRAPLDGEEMLKAMDRYLRTQGAKVNYRLATYKDGTKGIRWNVVLKPVRELKPEHLEKLRNGAKARAAKAQKTRAANKAAAAKVTPLAHTA
jgi:hypothetical protein